MAKDKTSMYILVIVIIVAVVGGFTLIYQNLQVSEDLAGQFYVVPLQQEVKLIPRCTLASELEDCSGYACNEGTGTCTESCEVDIDCAEGYMCRSPRCVIVSTAEESSFEEREDDEYTFTLVEPVDINEVMTDDNLVFELEPYFDGEVKWGKYTSLTDESSYEHKATNLVNVHSFNRKAGIEFKGDPSYVTFDDHYSLDPSVWIVVEADVYIERGDRDQNAIILSKQTTNCGTPLYALTINNGKFHFVISIDGEKYTLTSDSDVSSTYIMGVYDGSEIKFYVYDSERQYVEEDSISVSGPIEAGKDPRTGRFYPHYDLALGYSTICNDFQYEGFVTGVGVWGQ